MMAHVFRQSNFTMGGSQFLAPQASAWTDTQLGYDPVTTDLVVGTPQVMAAEPGAQIFRPVTTTSMSYKYPIFGTEHLKRFDTARGPSGDIRTSGFAVTTARGDLERHTFAHRMDELEIELTGKAEPTYDGAFHSAMLSRMVVRLDIEATRADLLQTTSNYTNTTALSAGSEFNGGSGDMRTSIRTAAATILASTPGATYADLVAFMPQSTLDAAVEDTAWEAIRSNGGDAMLPSPAQIATYLGIKRVDTGNPIAEQDDGTIAPLYADVCVLYYENPGREFDTSRGSYLDFATRGFRNEGGARQPWFSDGNTTWYYPWEEFTLPVMNRETAAHLLTNCSATV